MAKESERMRQMKENFMKLHAQGLSVPEIAEKYNLGESTVYKKLQEIADANGVTRDSLLQQVKTPTERAYREEAERVKVNVGEMREGFEAVKERITFLVDVIEDVLKEEKENGYFEG